MTPTLSFLLATAVVFTLVALIVLRPLLRAKVPAQLDSAAEPAAQRASLQEAAAGIEAEFSRGEIDGLARDARMKELLLRARADATQNDAPIPNSHSGARRWLAAGCTLGLAAVSALFYLWLGNPAAMNPAMQQPVAKEGGVGPAQVAEMVKRLEAKLSAGPPKAEDLAGWKMLARSQMVMQQFGKAVETNRIALKLAPDSAEIQTNLAEALLSQSDGKVSDEIEKLLASAYAREPLSPKILWMSAAVAQEQGNKPKAIKFLKEARATLPPESDEVKQIDQFISDLSK